MGSDAVSVIVSNGICDWLSGETEGVGAYLKTETIGSPKKVQESNLILWLVGEWQGFGI